MKTLNYIKITALLLVLSGFVRSADTYEEEIKSWHNTRIENLKKENGWLNLAGLFWLEEGASSFGTDPQNQIVFPKGKSDELLGQLTLKNNEVFLDVAPGVSILTNDDQPVSHLKIFPSEKPIILKHRSLKWTIIKRGEKYGVRLRDLESPVLSNFEGIKTFPVDRSWKIKGRFIPTTGRKIAILDVVGNTLLEDSPGRVVFTIKNKTYSLDATGTTDELFLIFGDKTNKKETYGAGRFLYAAVDKDGFVDLDFNKSINPPCAFTPYATCPLPPGQNILAVSVNAGEKNYSYY